MRSQRTIITPEMREADKIVKEEVRKMIRDNAERLGVSDATYLRQYKKQIEEHTRMSKQRAVKRLRENKIKVKK